MWLLFTVNSLKFGAWGEFTDVRISSLASDKLTEIGRKVALNIFILSRLPLRRYVTIPSINAHSTSFGITSLGGVCVYVVFCLSTSTRFE